MDDVINSIDPAIWVSLITVLGGTFLKLLYDNRKSLKLQSQLLKVTEKKSEHDRRIAKLRMLREMAVEKRELAYEPYDSAAKELVGSIGRHIVEGNHVEELEHLVQRVDSKRKDYERALARYHTEMADITTEMLRA
jgi:hypothetical protein